MQRPPLLLQLVAKSVLSTVDSSVLDDVTVDINPDVVERIWREWREAASEVEMVADFETLANVSPDQLDNLIQATLPPDSNVSSDASQVVAAYLAHLPGAIRREFRRPTYPSGTTIPASWTMNEPTSLHALLPQQMPWYLPGDRPWDIGDWELVELYERSPLGELWKARSPNAPEATAFLHFFLHPSIKERLFRPDDFFTESGLDRVLQFVDHRNFLKLRRLHLIADPPCLEYEFFAGAPLFRAFREWTPENLPDSQTVIDIIVDIAEAVGFLHQLDPPIVHQAIRPDNVLLRTLPSGQWQCKILHAGAGSMIPLEVLLSRQIASNSVGGSIGGPVPASSATALSIDPLIYAAPEQLREEDAGPRMDVYAIGVLWYQLLTGNLHAPRPGGSQWRKRLVERNLSGELVELLESCFEDDPSFRPKDGNVLANQLRAITQAQETAISRTRRSEIQEERSAVSRSQTTQADGQQSESQAEEPPKETPATPKPEARKARTRQRRAAMDQLFDKLEAEAPEAAKSLTNSVDMKFVLLPAGIFVMGTDPAEAGCRQNEMPQHEVSLTHDFYVAVTLVTQEQYLRVIKQNPARHNPDNGGQLDHPVENVTWENAVEFCERLSNLEEERAAGRKYRLPTEAEWEYACRAGTITPFAYGEVLTSEHANFDGNFPYGEESPGIVLQRTSAVMQYPPNHFGLYDMHGNVWEWCADWLDARYYSVSPKRDPKGPSEGKYRVLRGGSWKNQGITCRSGYRNGLPPNLKDSATGFRVVLELGRS